MFNFIKKLIPTSPKMYLRVKNIFKYSELTTFESDKMHECLRGKTSTGVAFTITFDFNSALGPVSIDLTKNVLRDNAYSLRYCNYAGFGFTLQVDAYSVEVEPNMNEYFNAQTIDLAILELEEHLREVFGDVEEGLKRKILEEKQEIKKHKEELKKLY